MTRADITTGTGIVRLIDVHTVAPLNESLAHRWRAQLDLLAQLQPPKSGALIMAGDFNATLDHAPMDALVSGGMRDAFNEAGRGIGATWPQSSGPVPPLMRLDHVLVSDKVMVMSAEVHANPGSDHRRLSVELALPSATAPVSLPQTEYVPGRVTMTTVPSGHGPSQRLAVAGAARVLPGKGRVVDCPAGPLRCSTSASVRCAPGRDTGSRS